MKKNTVAKISIISSALSPVIGGMIGKFIAICDLFKFNHVYFDDGLVYLGVISWLVASILFYVHYNDKKVKSDTDIKNQG